jgi:hypothetical protein
VPPVPRFSPMIRFDSHDMLVPPGRKRIVDVDQLLRELVERPPSAVSR